MGFYGDYNSDENGDIYLFYDISDINIENLYIGQNSTIWFCVRDEIIKHNKICNFDINTEVIRFFEYNTHLLCLADINGDIYEYPNILYSGNYFERIKFEAVFCNQREETEYGNFYCFTDFKNSVIDGLFTKDRKPLVKNNRIYTCSDDGKYIVGGIVRYAVFCENITIENDKTNIEFSDNNNVNSIYVNKNKPIWIVKEYRQIIPLSYHKINKNICENDVKNNVLIFIKCLE